MIATDDMPVRWTEEQQELAAEFGITSIPTLVVFRDGIIVFNQPGALNSPQLEQALAAVRGLNMDEVRASMASRGTTLQEHHGYPVDKCWPGVPQTERVDPCRGCSA